MNIEDEGNSSIGTKPESLTLKLAVTTNHMSFPVFRISKMLYFNTIYVLKNGIEKPQHNFLKY